MENLLIIGPLPPPIQGETTAIKTILDSKKIRNEFNIDVINTSMGKKSGTVGSFSFRKLLRDLRIIIKLLKQVYLNNLNKKFDIVYLSISQTKLGLLRDLIILNIVSLKTKYLIVHLHGNNLGNTIDLFGSIGKKIISNTFKKVDLGIVLGENLINNYRGLISSVKIVQNGVDDVVTKDNNIILRNNKNQDQEVKIIYLSNLIKAKGFIDLIEACIDLIRDGLNIKLTLAGAIYDQLEAEMIFKKVEKLGLKKFINYVGIVEGEEKRKLLLESDIMVLPTKYPVEGQPLSILEGMSAGLPIISSEIGCIPEMVTDNGILLKEVNINSLKEAIKYLIDSKDVRIEMGLRSRKYYLEKYTTEKYIDRLLTIFRSV